MLPMVVFKLYRCSPGVGTFIVDYEKLEYGSVACQAQKYVSPDCALCLFGMCPLKKGEILCKLLRKYP